MTDLSRAFPRAVDRLAEALDQPETDLTRDGAIQRFEFCFELAWKLMQKSLRREGIDVRSPRASLRAAFQQGWIDEVPWLAMLSDRNLTSHTYDEDLAAQVYSRLGGHLDALRQAAGRLASGE